LNIASRAVVVSTGEPAGIGPDICIMLADGDLAGKPLFIGSAGVLRERIAALRRSTRIQTLTAAADAAAHRAGVLQLLDVPAPAEVVAGRLDRRNAAYVLELLRQGTELCLRGECAPRRCKKASSTRRGSRSRGTQSISPSSRARRRLS
jgi:4-hydroxythreonine-4-phosphate dehydrogenase